MPTNDITKEFMGLYNENTFYPAFIEDLEKAKKEVIIGAPYVMSKRMYALSPVFKNLTDQNVKMYVVTRPTSEYKKQFQAQGEKEIKNLQQMGVNVIFSKNDNRVFAIIDREISWDGSLNILSEVKSRDVMCRITDHKSVQELLDFLQLDIKQASLSL